MPLINLCSTSFADSCDAKLYVFMPSNEAVIDLLPEDGSNPFETSALLRHKTVFGHIFYEDVVDKEANGHEKNITALNGAQVSIKKVEATPENGGEGIWKTIKKHCIYLFIILFSPNSRNSYRLFHRQRSSVVRV